MNKKTVISSLVTVFVTMIIVYSIALISEVSLLWRSEKKVVKIELSKKIYNRFHTIATLEKRIQKDPQDYKAHILLAQKYNEIQEYDSANVYFQTALKISERSNYSLYSYSMFCIERKLYNLALNLAEEISLYNKKAILYKAKIYESIAKSLDDDREIEGSIRAYQVAYKYAKGVYSKEDFETLKTNYAKEYIKMADIKIAKKETKKAILDINNSLRIKETPIAQYKLALIYKDIDKIKSEKLIKKVLDRNPYIVNPYIYNDLLNKLLEESRSNGSTNRINYYTNKINSFNKILNQIYVFKDDLKVSGIDIFSKKIKFIGKEELYIKYNIENQTKNEISDLYVLTELYLGGKKIQFENNVTAKTTSLRSNSSKTVINKLPPDITKDTISFANDIIIKFYAKKQNKAPWTLIKIQQFK